MCVNQLMNEVVVWAKYENIALNMFMITKVKSKQTFVYNVDGWS
jgi:hypothetical protein